MKTKLSILSWICVSYCQVAVVQSATFVPGLVPDWNQPNWHGANQSSPHPQNGGPGSDPVFRAWCVPTSMANVIGHWDDVHLIPNGLPAIADGQAYPASSTSWASGPGYQDFQANGEPTRSSLPAGVTNDHGWYMNTNGQGVVGGGHTGTLLNQVSAGASAGINLFFSDRGSGTPRFRCATHGSGYADPGLPLLPLPFDGFFELQLQVDAGRTVIAHFSHWNILPHLLGPPALPGGQFEIEHGFDYYLFDVFSPNGQGDLSDEIYNNSDDDNHLGHAVTVVGYIMPGSPDDPTGNTSWVIVHDNDPATPRNVAVPLGPEWVANTIITSNTAFLLGLVPDWNQPNWHGAPANQLPPNPPNGGPFPSDPIFRAWCVPTSMANVLGHWDHAHLLPLGLSPIGDGMDYPISLVPFGVGPSWQDYQANGQPTRSSMPPGVPNDLGWYMDTNGQGIGGGASHTGTLLRDASGVNQFFGLAGPDFSSYTHGTVFTDPQIPKLFNLQDAYNELRRSLASNRAAIAHFTHWNLTLVQTGSFVVSGITEEDFGFDYYSFGAFQTSGAGDLEDEVYNNDNDPSGSLLGHAVTVVGCIDANAPGDLLGNTNWLIVHDNDSATPRNVAVPLGPEWVANTIITLSTDSDGDGKSDFDEALTGTDPHDRNSKLEVIRIERLGGATLLVWRSVLEKSYRVQYFDPGSTSWSTIATVQGVGATTSYFDNAASRAGLSVGLFRVGVAP